MMNKHTATHLVWALIAGAAWWFGSRQPAHEDLASSRRSAAGRFAVPESQGTAVPKSPGAPNSTAEVATWLDQWRSAGGPISPEQMSAAVLAALRDPDQVRGLRNFTHLLENLTPASAAAAVETLKTNAGAGDSGVWLELLCSAWGAKDGASALATLTERREREAAMSAWAASDPAAAQTWLANLPAGNGDNGVAMEEDKRDLQRSMISGLARRDVQAAEAYITAQPERERSDLARVAAREMFRRGGAEAGEWAASLQDSDMRGAALEMVARKYMAAVPAEGQQWAADNATAPDMRAAVGRVADRMAEQDVLAAYTWTQQLPPGPGQEEAYQQVFSQWAREDPTASSQELLGMTPSPNRDQAIHSFSRSLVKENPESAIAWAGAISDPAQRLETQIDVARQWHGIAPEPAAAWITANLPADARAKALAGD
jgi:hypothetical protein